MPSCGYGQGCMNHPWASGMGYPIRMIKFDRLTVSFSILLINSVSGDPQTCSIQVRWSLSAEAVKRVSHCKMENRSLVNRTNTEGLTMKIHQMADTLSTVPTMLAFILCYHWWKEVHWIVCAGFHTGGGGTWEIPPQRLAPPPKKNLGNNIAIITYDSCSSIHLQVNTSVG